MNKMLGEIFERPVDRTIEGVIKADDDASLKIEIDEYVLTNEIESKLEAFANAYATYETANGVWISGFFGSGKSHLLKMLAILLDNREIEGVRAYDLFAPKCAENKILAADLKRAVEIPSRSVLFNIDQKADVIAKTQTDALLGVFQKVFDELSGYYGKQPYIAQFERDLDSRNILVAFKVAYAEIARKPWQRGREQTILEGANIAKAYCVATGSPESEATGILDKYRKDYRSSIEDFADRVKTYVDAQGPKFRLNFFVDEVGQYIADNVKLMTNLQTIAESLNTKCRGRAWIVVTAQQDMASVIGDMTQSQENDFSKIQARFANRIPLNSADVAEVIQRRLLEKTDEGIALLSDMHHVQAAQSQDAVRLHRWFIAVGELSRPRSFHQELSLRPLSVPNVSIGYPKPERAQRVRRQAQFRGRALHARSVSGRSQVIGENACRSARHLRPDVRGHSDRAEIQCPTVHPHCGTQSR